MGVVAVIAGLALVGITLWDMFETVVLPRRVTRRLRVTRLTYRLSWGIWTRLVGLLRESRRDTFLAVYGPLSLIVLLALWAALLICGWGVAQWGLGSQLSGPPHLSGFLEDLYYSGTTFFTLGLGDVTPTTAWARLLTLAEAGNGFAVLGLVIGYLPVLYQSFARREQRMALLDARAGSPPTAVEMLRRYTADGDLQELGKLLQTFEEWSSDLLESHSSYPMLAYFRSQHDHESWVAALTMLLDVCALVMIGVADVPVRTARWTYAMATHAAIDLSQIFAQRPPQLRADRLDHATYLQVRAALEAAGVPLSLGADAEELLAALRAAYEPYVTALSRAMHMPLPRWLPSADEIDDWQTSGWELSSALPAADSSRISLVERR
jgi:hypothetical protein